MAFFIKIHIFKCFPDCLEIGFFVGSFLPDLFQRLIGFSQPVFRLITGFIIGTGPFCRFSAEILVCTGTEKREDCKGEKTKGNKNQKQSGRSGCQ